MKIEIRPARPEDAGHLTELVNMAGEGMPLYLWTKSAAPGVDPWEHGRLRACDPNVGFNWRNSNVALVDGQVAGSLAHYPLPEEPTPIGPDLPAAFVPLVELENEARGTHYINILAVYPDYRGHGVGRRLMQHAETAAQGRDLSLIVENANIAAQSLYRSLGFEQTASRAIVDGGWAASGDRYCLMVRKSTE